MTSHIHFYNTSIRASSIKEEGITWACKRCGKPLLGTSSIDAIQLEHARPQAFPVCGVVGYRIAIVHVSFLEILGDSVVGDNFMMGDVIDNRGRVFSDWKALVGKHQLFIRGSTHVVRRACEVCGQKGYFAAGKRYLCPAPEPGKIYQSHLTGIVVPVTIAAPLLALKRKGTGAEKLSVIDPPLDGLAREL